MTVEGGFLAETICEATSFYLQKITWMIMI